MQPPLIHRNWASQGGGGENPKQMKQLELEIARNPLDLGVVLCLYRKRLDEAAQGWFGGSCFQT